MSILVLLVFVFGVYTFIQRARNRELPDDARKLGARIGRSVHASIPLPGLMGQAPSDFLPQQPIRESVGPDESHTLRVDESGRPVLEEGAEGPSDLGPYRDPDAPEAAAAIPKPGAKRKRKPRMPRKTTFD